jgi:dTDP-4-dehydrorhamnose reductase
MSRPAYVWVLGSRGQLGAAICNELLKSKYKDANIHLISTPCDVTDIVSLFAKVKVYAPTHIINCAAFTNVDEAESYKELAYNVNRNGPANIAAFARAYNARVLHFSSDYVIGDYSEVTYLDRDVCMKSPINYYGETKLKGEDAIADILPSHKFLIIRTSWLFSEIGKNFVLSILEKCRTGNELRVVGDQRGKPTYAKDLAEVAVSLFLNHDASGIIHLANEESTTWFEFAREIRNQAQSVGLLNKDPKITRIKTEDLNLPARRPKNVVLNNSIVETGGFRGPIAMRPWKSALKECLENVKRKEADPTC